MHSRTLPSIEGIRDDGTVRLCVTTSDPIRMEDHAGERYESLDPAGCDYEACRSVLLVHDPMHVVGSVRSIEVHPDRIDAIVHIDDDAVWPSGVRVRSTMADPAGFGASIGYRYDYDDADYDDGTVRVRRWRLLEITLTPTPADITAGVRSLSAGTTAGPTTPERMSTMDFSEWLKEHKGVDDPAALTDDELASYQAEYEEWSESAEDEDRSDDDADDVDDDDVDDDDQRTTGRPRRSVDDVLRRAKQVGVFLRSHGIDYDPAKHLTMDMDRARDLVISHYRRSMQSPRSSVRVTRDGRETLTKAYGNGLIRSAGLRVPENEPCEYISTEHLMRRCAMEQYGREAENWDRDRLAQTLLRSVGYSRSGSPNKGTGMFSTLLGNVANKALLQGFSSWEPTYDQWCTIKEARDFNAHPHVGLAAGNLQLTAENEAPPELTQAAGSYNSTLKMYANVLTLSYQMLVNDELGEFLRGLHRFGMVAHRTIDYQVYYALLNATWTNDTAAGALATAGGIDTVRAAHQEKLSPAGEKMGIPAAYLLCDIASQYAAEVQTGELYGRMVDSPTVYGSTGAARLKVVPSTWIGDTSLKSGVAATDYYLASNPAMVDTCTVEFLPGFREPRIEEFDPGAPIAQRWKIYLPFAATMATHTDSAGNARVTGCTQGTAD